MKPGFHFLRTAALRVAGFGFAAWLAASGICLADVLDRIVAVVNDDIILMSEVKAGLKPYVEKIRAMGYPEEQERHMISRLSGDLIEKMIDQRLTIQQADQMGISVSDQEVERTISRIKESGGYSEEKLKEEMIREGLSMPDYRKEIRDQLIRTKLVDYEVKSKIVVTEEDIRAYYENHPEEFQGEVRYHLRNIFMRVSSFAGAEEKTAVLRRMEDVYEKLEAGADFAEMARRYTDSSLASSGGDLGYFKFEDLAPRIQEALEGKPEDSYTEILDTDQGFQIFYIENIAEEPAKSLASVSDAIHDRIYKQRVNERFESWIRDLRERSHIRVMQ